MPDDNHGGAVDVRVFDLLNDCIESPANNFFFARPRRFVNDGNGRGRFEARAHQVLFDFGQEADR